MGAKDITEKTLEAYNDVFSDIVNGLLFHGKQLVQEDMLTDAQPVSMYKADGGIHEHKRYLELLFKAKARLNRNLMPRFG